MAADHIGEGLGGFLVEATAAVSILAYIAFLWLANRWDQKSSANGIIYSVLTGICVGAEPLYFFCSSKKAVPFPQFLPFWRAARRSWPSLVFCFFAKLHPGTESSVLRLP